MRIIKKLRNATEHGKQASQRVLGRALESGRNLERRLRQKMRVYPCPRPTVAPMAAPPADIVMEEQELEEQVEPEPQSRKPIVSVHGRDVASSAERAKLEPSDDRKVA